jgi:hypothetical protein
MLEGVKVLMDTNLIQLRKIIMAISIFLTALILFLLALLHVKHTWNEKTASFFNMVVTAIGIFVAPIAMFITAIIMIWTL